MNTNNMLRRSGGVYDKLYALSYAFLLENYASSQNVIIKNVICFLLPIWVYVLGGLALVVGKVRPKKKECTFKYDIAVVAIAKNESEYIREWCAFHKIVGVDVIYLYDNESTDDMKNEIQDFIDEGFVVYEVIRGQKKQFDAYNHALKNYGEQCRYMAFIDCDEFLIPLEEKRTVGEMIEQLFSDDYSAGGLSVNWCMYGSSGYSHKPDGTCTGSFLYRANTCGGRGNNCVKSIVKPECVKRFAHPHYPIYKFGFCGFDTFQKPVKKGAYVTIEQYNKLRINHYFTKSREQWITRRSLGMADRDLKRPIEEFDLHDNNDVFDGICLQYQDELKQIMERKENI